MEFSNISQRAVYSYINALGHYEPPAAEDPSPQSYRDVHAFFTSAYGLAFENSEQWGMPLSEDLALDAEHQSLNGKDLKQLVMRRIKRARQIMEAFIDFMILIGRSGTVNSSGVAIDKGLFADYMDDKPRVKRKIFAALSSILVVDEDETKVSAVQHPAMFESLAWMCEQDCDNEKLFKFNVSRLDWAALRVDTVPPNQTLFTMFTPDQYLKLSELDRYFKQRGYSSKARADGVHSWDIKYQGKRSKKSTPLFQIGYDERYHEPLRLSVKCAAANRVLTRIHEFSDAIKSDFAGRLHTCNEEACGWCKTRPNLGPSLIVEGGNERKVCWYTKPDVEGLNDQTVELIREYEQLHSSL